MKLGFCHRGFTLIELLTVIAIAVVSNVGEIGPVTGYNDTRAYNSKRGPKKQSAFVNHRGRTNRVCVDGHIEPEDLRKNFAGTDEQLRRWHNDHQPHRELFRD